MSNGARNLWVTETALTTALNVSYMAEQLALFGIVVGIALLLAGIGFIILALAVFGKRRLWLRERFTTRRRELVPLFLPVVGVVVVAVALPEAGLVFREELDSA